MRSDSPVIRWSAAAEAARLARTPLVALESSVLAQGLPIPVNAEALTRMQHAVRAAGAVEAITGVVHGAPAMGLEPAELTRFLARTGVLKVSARDLGVAMAKRRDGATTVAGTLALCRAADVRVFATGGIGGVHPEPDFDESADLVELSRSQVVVVCAGAKSILNLPATLERLESLGVTVVGYRTDEFPGFFTASTGLRVPARAESPHEIAAIAKASWRVGHPGAVLVVQPPPASSALAPDVVQRAVDDARIAAQAAGVRGAALTPYLLAAIEKATNGRSLRANVALLEANAALAAQVSVAFSVPAVG
jgi:pseudouridine-5'-phosphate glycosidase